jgi:hypothetical protein
MGADHIATGYNRIQAAAQVRARVLNQFDFILA